MNHGDAAFLEPAVTSPIALRPVAHIVARSVDLDG
jgi:hypothetical protein